MKTLTCALFLFFVSTSLIIAQQQPFYDVTYGDGNGVRLWQNYNNDNTYKIHMGYGAEYFYGPVSDYSIKMNMSNTPGRGWVWGVAGAVPIAALNTLGQMQIANSFTVGGDIILPSVSGNKQIYTWSPNDANWRIGMSINPGFTRALATGHIEYLTYSTSPGQGFAVGVNNGLSSFEVVGSDHSAFFRGNVGLGTTTLTHRLNVNGSTLQYAENAAIGVDAQANARLGLIKKAGFGPMIASDATAPIIFAQSNQTGIHTNIAGATLTERMRIDVNGNVGVATTNTESIFQAGGGSWRKVGLSTDGIPTLGRLGQDVNGITVSSNAYYNGGWSRDDSSKPSFALIEHLGNQRFEFRVSSPATGSITWGTPMVITANELVGIGTVNPTQKLTVNGTIYGKEVKVDLNVPGPDYVFEKGYSLPSLDEIKSYVDQHKHLPEVPSAKEMEQNGINLSEMNMILLKKVEELTLMMINQNDKNEKLTEEVRVLQSEIKILKNNK